MWRAGMGRRRGRRCSVGLMAGTDGGNTMTESPTPSPEERLLALGAELRASPDNALSLVAWTREVERQLHDLRERLDDAMEANDLWSGR